MTDVFDSHDFVASERENAEAVIGVESFDPLDLVPIQHQDPQVLVLVRVLDRLDLIHREVRVLQVRRGSV